MTKTLSVYLLGTKKLLKTAIIAVLLVLKRLGEKEKQEDTLACLAGLDQEGNLLTLTPEKIGHRLWSAHKQLDAEYLNDEDGTTASSNYYDGKGNIITATLADAVSFAVIYDKKGEIYVSRLNSLIHHPTEDSEKERIKSLGGMVNQVGRLCTTRGLNISRAIGDHDQTASNNQRLISSDSLIDITSIDKLVNQFNLDKNSIDKIEIITTSDGFTQPIDMLETLYAISRIEGQCYTIPITEEDYLKKLKHLTGMGDKAKDLKEKQELYLKKSLQNKDVQNKHGVDLCGALANRAEQNGSSDNISVTMQMIFENDSPSDKPAFWGVYDGHSGDKASTYVAQNIGGVFRSLCAMGNEEYQKNEYSVHNHKEAYARDHSEKQKKTTNNKNLSHEMAETNEQIVARYYKFGQDEHTRGHFKKVTQEGRNGFYGDKLKAAILHDVCEELKMCGDTQDVTDYVKTFKKSKDYETLNVRQNWLTTPFSFFCRTTSSISAFEQMVSDRITNIEKSLQLTGN